MYNEDMQSGQYIVDRLMVQMVREICDERNIKLHTFSDNWLMELKKSDQTARIFGYKFSLNDSAASSIAQDKVAAYQLLDYYKVSAVPHYLIRTKANETNWKARHWPNGMVIKPLTGTSGHAVRRFENTQDAEEWIAEQGIEAWAVAPYFDIAREIRVIMLDQNVLLTYEKQPAIIDDFKWFNLGKGAVPAEYALSETQRLLAVKAQQALGLRLAAIDIIELNSGEQMVLEVNDGIMMENYARISNKNRVVAKEIYTLIIDVML